MTAPLRRPVAYEVAVGRHVPQPDMAQMDAEWSDTGRSPRFLPGWWLAPSFALGLAFWGVVGGYLAHAYVTHGAPDAALSAVQAEE